MNRIIAAYAPHQQSQARLMLAAVLRGVVSQRLVPRADGKSMIPAVEVLVGNARVRELIEDPARTSEIRDAMATSRTPYGMQTFDQSLAELVLAKLVTYQDAVRHASNPDDFALYFRGVSKSTDVDWSDTNLQYKGDPAGGAARVPGKTDDFEIIR